jgi:uncharacterized protein (DUF433 family)
MAVHDKVNWSECPLVEVQPEVLSGVPVLDAARMPLDAIIDHFDCGVSVAEITGQSEIAA